jgi:hypothetical protein
MVGHVRGFFQVLKCNITINIDEYVNYMCQCVNREEYELYNSQLKMDGLELDNSILTICALELDNSSFSALELDHSN